MKNGGWWFREKTCWSELGSSWVQKHGCSVAIFCQSVSCGGWSGCNTPANPSPSQRARPAELYKVQVAMVASGVCSSAVVPRSFLFPGPMSAAVAGKVGHSNAQVTGFTSYRTGMIPGMGWNHDLVSCSWLAFPCGSSFNLKKHMASLQEVFFLFRGSQKDRQQHPESHKFPMFLSSRDVFISGIIPFTIDDLFYPSFQGVQRFQS